MSADYEQQQEERPAQHQARQPGREAEMEPEPQTIPPGYRGSGKLEGRIFLASGDSSFISGQVRQPNGGTVVGS